MKIVGFGDFLIHFSPIADERFVQTDFMQVRNEWMVDRSNLVIAVFNGKKAERRIRLIMHFERELA